MGTNGGRPILSEEDITVGRRRGEGEKENRVLPRSIPSSSASMGAN